MRRLYTIALFLLVPRALLHLLWRARRQRGNARQATFPQGE